MLIEMKEDVSSIKTDIKNIKDQNKKIEAQDERLGKLETKVSEHDSHFKLLWYLITGVLIFLGADILAPLVVNWLSK
ncbi:hypothetical protein [Lactobacillus amylolyticus]|uniref:hypothetical protein n=1 Tax=Lactobacillus amylolyticus TaxID=83683 RepID=UPI002493779D|nr:hypothetical protein [Lactobacillus amylolyticus]